MQVVSVTPKSGIQTKTRNMAKAIGKLITERRAINDCGPSCDNLLNTKSEAQMKATKLDGAMLHHTLFGMLRFIGCQISIATQ